MKLKSIQQSILAVALLSSSFFTFAGVLCPSVGLIQNSVSMLDTISSLDSKYAVWSSGYAFNDGNLNWQVISYVAAEDFNTAFSAAQNNVRSVSGQIDKYALVTDYYVCRYSGGKDTVFAFSSKEGNSKLKFSSFGSSLLNLNVH
jgi:glycine/serine hydroxymethyltransferase